MNIFNDLESAMKHLSKTGAFLTTKHGETVNTMTISWGFIGFMWGKPCLITVVRPQRFSKELLDQTDSFTVSIPYGHMKEELKICGTKSGRDINKAEVVSFVDAKMTSAPVVANCDRYYECKLQCVDQFDEASLPKEIIRTFYEGDFHHLYFGEIVESYGR